MMTAGEHAWQAAATAAETALAATFGGPVRLGPGETLRERTTIFRFPVVDGPPGLPAGVVVKGARPWDEQPYNPEATAFPSPAWRLLNEWAGLQFLNAVAGDPPLAPRLYAADRAQGLLVLEDLGPGAGLDGLLLGANPAAAEAGLLALAATLGRMHGRTAGRQADFNRIRDGLGLRAHAEYETYAWLATAFAETAAAVDITPAPGTAADVAALIAAFRDPGPFLAYVHGDPCPDNYVATESGMRLLDFESGRFGHALQDGVYGRIHFPSCWCVNRLPAPLPVRMESAYRAELVQGCPAAADDRLFQRAMVDACAYWAITMCQWNPLASVLQADDTWGEATLRQRVLLRFGIIAGLTAEQGHLEALGATLGAIAAQLRARWPAEAAAMPVYPAFRSAPAM